MRGGDIYLKPLFGWSQILRKSVKEWMFTPAVLKQIHQLDYLPPKELAELAAANGYFGLSQSSWEMLAHTSRREELVANIQLAAFLAPAKLFRSISPLFLRELLSESHFSKKKAARMLANLNGSPVDAGCWEREVLANEALVGKLKTMAEYRMRNWIGLQAELRDIGVRPLLPVPTKVKPVISITADELYRLIVWYGLGMTYYDGPGCVADFYAHYLRHVDYIPELFASGRGSFVYFSTAILREEDKAERKKKADKGNILPRDKAERRDMQLESCFRFGTASEAAKLIDKYGPEKSELTSVAFTEIFNSGRTDIFKKVIAEADEFASDPETLVEKLTYNGDVVYPNSSSWISFLRLMLKQKEWDQEDLLHALEGSALLEEMTSKGDLSALKMLGRTEEFSFKLDRAHLVSIATKEDYQDVAEFLGRAE